jgi:hypothetical protein
MKEEWEKMSEKEIVRYDERLQDLRKKKRTKSLKKIKELLRECKKILCSLIGDWKLTRCQEEEHLEMKMKRAIMVTRGGRRISEDVEDGTENGSAAAIDDLGTSARDKIVGKYQVLEVEEVLDDRQVMFEVVEDDFVIEKTARPTDTSVTQKNRQKTDMKPNLKTPMKINKLRKMTTTSPLASRKIGSLKKMINTPPRTARSLRSCNEPGPYIVKQMVEMFEGGQQTLHARTNSKFKLTNNFATKPYFVYSSSLESRNLIEPAARPANQWEERAGTAPGSRCPPMQLSKPLSQWEERKDQRGVLRERTLGHQPRPEWNEESSTEILSECT